MASSLTAEQKDHIRAVIASATTPEEVNSIEAQLKVSTLSGALGARAGVDEPIDAPAGTLHK